MRYVDYSRLYDAWKRQNREPLEFEIEVTDYREVPIEFLEINYQAVIDAYKDGQIDIPGLKIWKEEP